MIKNSSVLKKKTKTLVLLKNWGIFVFLIFKELFQIHIIRHQTPALLLSTSGVPTCPLWGSKSVPLSTPRIGSQIDSEFGARKLGPRIRLAPPVTMSKHLVTNTQSSTHVGGYFGGHFNNCGAHLSDFRSILGTKTKPKSIWGHFRRLMALLGGPLTAQGDVFGVSWLSQAAP